MLKYCQPHNYHDLKTFHKNQNNLHVHAVIKVLHHLLPLSIQGCLTFGKILPDII